MSRCLTYFIINKTFVSEMFVSEMLACEKPFYKTRIVNSQF